ncbi:protein DOWN-REGULATED IN DIF1 11-like [Capsicum galapagoense]
MAIKSMRVIDIVAIAIIISLLTPKTLGDSSDITNPNYDELDAYGSSLYYSIPDEHRNHEEAFAPAPYAEQVEECLDNISDDCGAMIFNRIMDNGKYTNVEDCCCFQLLTLGRKCHNAIIESTLARHEMKGVNAAEIWKNSDKLWEECESISPSPSY